MVRKHKRRLRSPRYTKMRNKTITVGKGNKNRLVNSKTLRKNVSSKQEFKVGDFVVYDGNVGKIDNISGDRTIADIIWNDGDINRMTSLPLKVLRKFENLNESLSSMDVLNIGKKHGLTGKKLGWFSAFITKKMPEENSVSYVGEWAQRFKKGNVFAYADPESKVILRNLGYSE